ncbi:MAG: hypothetical protein RLZZ450_1569 [Pseudomonadota bacterium]|jgi:hypothetical protein
MGSGGLNGWNLFGGFSHPCNTSLPLARMFDALWALGYSGTNSPTCDTTRVNKTEWAMCWAANNTCKLQATCEGSALATTRGAQNKIGECYNRFSNSFFYASTVAERASTVFHEARHSGAGGCGHNAGTSCPRGGSCDKSWTNGCEESAGKEGANKYQVLFLESYAFFGFRLTTALKQSAVARGNVILTQGYQTFPCKIVTSSGLVVDGGC